MFTFNEWVDLLEARRPVFVGGAFGKAGKKQVGIQKGAYTHSREEQRSLQGPQAYEKRVSFGLTQEDKILNAAKNNCKLNLSKSSDYEDKYLKIDAWWSQDSGSKVPLQIKYRDTGNDLLFEVIKPYTNLPLLSPINRLGRDVKPPGKPANQFNPASTEGAKYLLHLNKEGTLLRILDLIPCYQIIHQMMQAVDQKGWSDTYKKIYQHPNGAVLRWQIDASSHVQKIVAYIPPNATNVIFQCNVNIQIG
jgi:hypothetical protein